MQLITYRDPAGFTALEAEWNELLTRSEIDTIFMTREWQSTWWRAFGVNKELLLLAFRRDDALVGIAPLYRQVLDDNRAAVRLVGGTEVTDYLGIITLPGHREAVYTALFEHFATTYTAWDELDLHCLPAASPHQSLCKIAEGRELFVQSELEDVCPIIDLPNSWDEYMNMLDKKQRHEIRRKTRRALREVEMDWYIAHDPETLRGDVEAFLDLHRKSAPAKDDFMDTPAMESFFHEVARFALARGWLELSFLTMNGEPAASLFCFAYRNHTLVYNSGYDPDRFGYLSPGVILTAYHIEDSIKKNRAVFDFLRGDEEYKYRFGARDAHIFQVRISRAPARGENES